MGSLESGPLFSSLLIGTVGLAMLIYGKKAARPWWLVAGIAMCVLPYFVESVVVMWLAAVGCVAGAVVGERVG